MAASPTRKTSERDLDLFNQQIRASDVYQTFIKSRGLWRADGKPVKWSEQHRKEFARELARTGIVVPKGMKIDDYGNFNQRRTHSGRTSALAPQLAPVS